MISHQCFGAQILQVNDLLFLSELSTASDLPKRGGIPILFPQFAEWGNLRKHGFVRDLNWQLQSGNLDHQHKSIHYKLQINPQTYPRWPHNSNIELLVESEEKIVHIKLTITNTGVESFSWSGGLHPYFKISNLMGTTISGLQNTQGIRHDKEVVQMNTNELRFTNELFEVLFDSPVLLLLNAGDKTLKISSQGFTEWMIWNPGQQGCKQFKDLNAVDWLEFICIEPVCVRKSVPLDPQKKFVGSLVIELLD